MDKKIITLAACSLAALQASAKAPNIVLILADDMGYGDVSALNPDSKIHTPNLDAIARQGAVFTDAHATSSLSTPSRYSIITGRYNWRSTLKSGVLGGYSESIIPATRTTMPEMLQQQGYHTACIGKWHLGWHWANAENGNANIDYSKTIADGPTERGFDYFYGAAASLDMAPYVYVENRMPTMVPDSITPDYNDGPIFWREGPISADFRHADVLENYTARACNHIRQQAQGDAPFMLYYPMTAPHTPTMPSKEYDGKSGLGLYADFVMMVDGHIGRILDAIREAGIEENTIVIFTTDNGCAPYIHPEELVARGHYPSYIYRGYKSDIYEGGHRIPLLVKYPAKIKPHTIDQTVSLVDFMGTFAALTGYKLQPDQAEDSYDLTPLLFKPSYKKQVRDLTIHTSGEGVLAIRSGDWKLVMSSYSGGWGYPTKKQSQSEGLPDVQLFNLKDDPSERTNVYAQYPDVVKALTAKITACVENGRSTPGPAQPNDKPEWWPQLTWISQGK